MGNIPRSHPENHPGRPAKVHDGDAGASHKRRAAALLAEAWDNGGDASDALALARAPSRQPEPLPDLHRLTLEGIAREHLRDDAGRPVRVPFPPQPDRQDGQREIPDWEARRLVARLSRPETFEEWRASVRLSCRADPDVQKIEAWARRSWLGPRGERFEEYDPRWNHDPRLQRWRSDVGNRAKAEAAGERYKMIRDLRAAGHSIRKIAAAVGCGVATVDRALKGIHR